MNKGYIKLRPSQAEQWVNCPGSVQIANDPLIKGNRDAFIGTTTHSILDSILTEYVTYNRFYRAMLKTEISNNEFIHRLCSKYLESSDLSMSLTETEKDTITRYVKQGLDGLSGIVPFYDSAIFKSLPKDFQDEKQKNKFAGDLRASINSVVSGSEQKTYYFSASEIYLPHKVSVKGKNFSLGGTIDYLGLKIIKSGMNYLEFEFDIIDFKSGWIPVNPEESEQLEQYQFLVIENIVRLICAIIARGRNKYNFLQVSFRKHIIQTSLNSRKSSDIINLLPEAPLYEDTKIVNPKDLLQVVLKIVEGKYKKPITKIANPKSHLVVGPHCAYCPAADVCPKFIKHIQKFLHPEFRDLSIDRVKEWVHLLDMIKPIEKVAEDVKNRVKTYLHLGYEIPGWALVPRAGKRAAKNEEGITEVIRRNKKIKIEDYRETKLKPVTQIEKQLKKDGVSYSEIESLYYQPVSMSLKKIKKRGK